MKRTEFRTLKLQIQLKLMDELISNLILQRERKIKALTKLYQRGPKERP